MKNFVMKIANVKSYISQLSTIIMILVVGFTFTAAAAMALDTAVSHHGLGVAAFAFGLVLVFVWIIDTCSKGIVKGYKDWRGEEQITFISNILYASLGTISLILTIISLGLH